MDRIKLDETPITGVLRDLQPLALVRVDTKEKEQLWDFMVRTWHYLSYESIIGPRIKYLIFRANTPIGALSFNQAALRTGVRDAWIGLSHEEKRKSLPHIVNNNRFLILPWVQVKNLASHILSKALHQLKRDWPKLYGVEPYLVETFVDYSRYQGTCYKASNWLYLGETSGYGKVGKTFVYHGNRKRVFVYILNRRFHKIRVPFSARQPKPNLLRAREDNMLLRKPDWSPELFAEIGLNEETVSDLGDAANEYLDIYSPCYSRRDQQHNGELYTKGLLSDLERKSIEPIALRYQGVNAVRPLQMFLKESPWDDQQMKGIYQHRVFETANDPNGMITVDGSDFAKKGNMSAGVKRQYCGSKGKVDNCQAGVFIGYAGVKGYGLLDAQLYLPEEWCSDSYCSLRAKCDIPENIMFKTKPQLALEMIHGAIERNPFTFKWVGCDGAYGCDPEFRKGLPETVLFFADVHASQHVYRTRPEWIIPEYSGRGKKPTKLVPSLKSVSVREIANDSEVPWHTIVLMEGSKGPVITQVKWCRVIESLDGKDGDELWLYIRKYNDGTIKYSFSNAPADIEIGELHHAAKLRWPIEQSFQECKSFLGMGDYETRSYIGWHRHMLLVMVAHLFVTEVRMRFKKKRMNQC